MIASLSFQLSWGCFISLPILTTFVYGIQVVLQAEVDIFSVRTVKFIHRTMSPVDHKLLSQNKFIMPNLYNRHGKSNVLQCYTFSCRNYPMQIVNIHISLAFPNGRIPIHKCSTGLSAGPFTHRCKRSVSLQVLCL